MKKNLIVTALAGVLFTGMISAQKNMTVPQAVKASFANKFPEAKQVSWEKEKGNYEANWGGKSGEDNSALYSPSAQFIEIAKAIAVKELPSSALSYLKSHYKNTSVNEAALVTNANGKISYEAEVNHKDVVFDQNGKFVKTEKE